LAAQGPKRVERKGVRTGGRGGKNKNPVEGENRRDVGSSKSNKKRKNKKKKDGEESAPKRKGNGSLK